MTTRRTTLADAHTLAAALPWLQNFHSSFGGKAEDRRRGYADMVNHYYDLATSFYEYGWGTSFHFAHRRRGETHSESIKRHEHFLALRLGLGPGRTVLDVGCGVGGPMREIALFSGASVVGAWRLRCDAMCARARVCAGSRTGERVRARPCAGACFSLALLTR